MDTESHVNERPHKKLEAWKKSIDFVSLVYRETKSYPRDEEFGLKSQLRRAAVSVPSNIAEGLTRKSQNDKLHFLNIAQASLKRDRYAAGNLIKIELPDRYHVPSHGGTTRTDTEAP